MVTSIVNLFLCCIIFSNRKSITVPFIYRIKVAGKIYDKYNIFDFLIFILFNG